MTYAKPLLAAMALTFAAQQAFALTPDEIRESAPQVPEALGPVVIDDFVALPGEENDVEIRTSGPHYYKQSLTSTKPRTTNAEDFRRLPGARTRIVLQPGQEAQVNVAFTAESRCNEPNSIEPNWCEVRVLVDGAEAAPAASSFPPDTFAFDSTDQGSETVASWEAHAMDRHKCVRNGGTAPRAVPIEVQWRVTNFGGGLAPNFWLDDWSMTVELARGCKFRAIDFPFVPDEFPLKVK